MASAPESESSFLSTGLITATSKPCGTEPFITDRLGRSEMGILIMGTTSLNSLIGTGFSRHVYGLDESIFDSSDSSTVQK